MTGTRGAPIVTGQGSRPWCVTSGKYSYRSRKRALGAMNNARAKAKDGGPVAVYKCRTCGDWHMTSQDRG